MGRKLALQLHHINGDNTDHRLENLVFLCPNCHSITDNFAGKGIKNRKAKESSPVGKKEVEPKKINYYCKECGKLLTRQCHTQMCQECYKKSIRTVERPDPNILAKEILDTSFLAVGRKYNVSDNTIRKWCKAYNIPTNKKEMLN